MQIELGKIANPYSMFAIVWTISLSIYLLQWSDVFPAISSGLLIFISCAIVSMLLISVLVIRIGVVKYIPVNNLRVKRIKGIFIFNLICWLLNFLYSGIPIVELLKGSDIDIHEFGIPTFKVFVLSFNSFFCVYLFHHYLSTKNRKYLWSYILGILLFILIFSRGLIMMTLLSTFFLWLLKKNNISFKNIVGVVSMFLLVMFIFGVAGNIRTAKIQTLVDGIDRKYSSSMILDIGQATEEFKSGFVPDEFFWGYIYIASPISNLQYNLKLSQTNLTIGNFLGFITNELTYDFISKRVNEVFNIPKLDYYLIVPELSVCTTFTGSYRYLGWLGLILFLGFISIIPLLYFAMIGKKNPILSVALCIFTSIYFFSFFDNMFVYSGLGLQIIYPLIFKYFRIS